MIPYNPNSPMALWYLSWRSNIRKAKENPSERFGYCQAAAIAQAQYVMYAAQQVVKERSR